MDFFTASYMEIISNFSNESVYFAIPYESEIIYLDAVHPNSVMSARSIIGAKAPLHCTDVGKVSMAYLTSEAIEQVIARELTSFTPNTITNRDMMVKELILIKDRGYAVDNMEHEYGIKCVAVPIRNIKENVIASISISGPSLRFTEEKILEYAKFLITISNELKLRIRE